MSDIRLPNDDDTRSGSESDQRLPDMAICRAKPAGFGDYADCLMDPAVPCQHALPFGSGRLCRHPQRLEIVARTQAQQGH